MTKQALFAGLVIDENDRAVETTTVGDEPFYVVDDGAFAATFLLLMWIVRC